MNKDLKKNFQKATEIIEKCQEKTNFHDCLEKKLKKHDPKIREIIERL